MINKDIIRLSIGNIMEDEFNYTLVLNSSFYFKNKLIIDEVLKEYNKLSLYHDYNTEENRCYIVKDKKHIISYLPIREEVSEDDMQRMWFRSNITLL